MKLSPENRLRFHNIGLILAIALLFGLSYNYLYYPHTLTEYLEAASISILIGMMVGIMEEYSFKKIFSRLPYLTVFMIRLSVYCLLVAAALGLVLSIEIALTEEIPYRTAIIEYFGSAMFTRDLAFSLVFVTLILFITQIIQLIGKANFFRLMLGLYHRPREVSRIFMFADIKGSTSIAERLSTTSYSMLLKRFFEDVSDAIALFRGEIYQYVGDEIIVVWPLRERSDNCIQCFFKMQEMINKNRDEYLQKFDLVPEFKAGIHAGSVMVTEVGKQKKDIVYHGDVLNTTSRIEAKCNELGQELLISQDLLPYLQLKSEFSVTPLGVIPLKGKAQDLHLYGVRLRN
ncbi:MAG: adenylate/guanylate cyclase domain-containing protein [Saprospiraceae bacterium]|nr:adenylate/guanylate cyclase domain-containing protein [Saprospiraceae bacterium]